jgi:hypothetical protein
VITVWVFSLTAQIMEGGMLVKTQVGIGYEV